MNFLRNWRYSFFNIIKHDYAVAWFFRIRHKVYRISSLFLSAYTSFSIFFVFVFRSIFPNVTSNNLFGKNTICILCNRMRTHFGQRKDNDRMQMCVWTFSAKWRVNRSESRMVLKICVNLQPANYAPFYISSPFEGFLYCYSVSFSRFSIPALQRTYVRNGLWCHSSGNSRNGNGRWNKHTAKSF